MELNALPEPIARLLRRADLAPLAAGVTVTVVESLETTFAITASGDLLLPPNCGLNIFEGAVTLRHALELALLRRLWPGQPVLAGLAASRTAALFAAIEEKPQMSLQAPAPDLAAMAGATPITADQACEIWPSLASHQPGGPRTIDPATMRPLRRIWPLLGPAEWLMQSGGDLRLALDPVTGLNVYGCSHRPHPWAVSFASSTASSSSEHGYRAAERVRQALLQESLQSDHAVAAALDIVRARIRHVFAMPEDVVIALASSGTDCELFALAAAHMHPANRPITNVLVAPEETGTGVPLAAAGRHFAVDAPQNSTVPRGGLIAGFREDTLVVSIPLRAPGGAVRPPSDIAAECEQVVEAAVAAGRIVLLHRVDVSKTGLLAPDTDAIKRLQDRFPGRVDVVVDACQTRLSPSRVQRYVADGWIVQLTGSKFLTGPPFSGAIIFPSSMQPRFAAQTLPIGLSDYSGRPEWPRTLQAAAALPPHGNAGLCLRWSAALAELEAFSAAPAIHQHDVIDRFTQRVCQAISANPHCLLIDVPPLERPGAGRAWDTLRTILSFAIRTGPAEPWLNVAEARRVFGWLNADLSRAIPMPAQRHLLQKRFHAGQPVKIMLYGAEAGVLRLSASARLFSSDPARAALTQHERLDLDIADALALLDKITLILQHWPEIQCVAPVATFI